MKRVNSFILLFFSVFILITFGAWQGLQSKWFANILKEKVSQEFLLDLGIRLDFDYLEFGVYPLRTKIINPHIEYKNDKLLRADFAEVSFSYLALFLSDLEIESIAIENGQLSIPDFFEKEESSTTAFDLNDLREIYQGGFKFIKEQIDGLPVSVRGITLRDVSLKINKDQYDITFLEMRNLYNLVELNLELYGLKYYDSVLDGGSIVLDSLKLAVQATENRLRVTEFEVFTGQSSLGVTGFVDTEDRSYITGYFRGGISDFINYVETDLDISGYVDLNFYLDESEGEISSSFDLYTLGLKTPFLQPKESFVSLNVRSGELFLDKLDVSFNEGSVRILEPVVIGSLRHSSILDFDFSLKDGFLVHAKIDNVHSSELLFFLDDILGIVKTNFDGQLSAMVDGLEQGKPNIVLNLEDGFIFKDFVLESPVIEDLPILETGDLVFDLSIIEILNMGEELFFDVGINRGDNFFPFEGHINQTGVGFHASEAYISLSELGPISGVDIYGDGVADIDIRGDFDDVVMSFDLDLVDARVLDLFLGELRANIKYNINLGELQFENAVSTVGQSQIMGHGELYFLDEKENLNISLVSERASYSDIINVFTGIIGDLELEKLPIEYFFNAEARIRGGFELDEMVVNSKVRGQEVQIFGEHFNSLSFDIDLASGILGFNEIDLQKTGGGVTGRVAYGLIKNDFSYDLNVKNLNLSDFRLYQDLGFGLEAIVNSRLSGSGDQDTLNSYNWVELSDSKIFGRSVSDSRLEMISEGRDVYVSAFVLNDIFTFDSYLNFDQKNKAKSFLNAKLKSENANELFGIFSAHNINDQSLRGNIDLDFQSRFDIFEVEKLDLQVAINNFFLSKGRFNLESKNQPTVIVQGGEIILWNLDIDGSDQNLFRSRGRGDFAEAFEVVTNVDIHADILEVISPKIISSRGRILTETVLAGIFNDLSHSSRMLATDLNFRIEGVPGNVTSGLIDLVMNEDEVVLQNARFSYGKGEVRAIGNINLDIPFPVVDLRWSVDNATIPIMKRSQVGVSGSGEIVGERFPYLVRGAINILHGQILESMDDFQAGGGQLEAYNRFIPREIYGTVTDFVRLDVLVDVDRPIQMRNSLTELYLEGEARVFGSAELPLATGEVRVVPERSKFKFKGYDFILSEGRVELNDTESRVPPRLNFVGTSQIGQYRVSVEVSGNVENLSIIMSSDPPLAQDDILSLLTLGVTRNISRELDEAERQQLTTIGLGALLFDQFQLTEGLSSSFGLRFSIAPEFSESETALIQGRSGVADSAATRVRSATRVRVQRTLSDRVDLSVSSTIGGSLEQRQEMNLNYRVNDRMSIQGIYEMKSREENVTNTPDSLGVDFKWRWSF